MVMVSSETTSPGNVNVTVDYRKTQEKRTNMNKTYVAFPKLGVSAISQNMSTCTG